MMTLELGMVSEDESSLPLIQCLLVMLGLVLYHDLEMPDPCIMRGALKVIPLFSFTEIATNKETQ